MKTSSYSVLQDAWFKRCYPENTAIGDLEKTVFFSFLIEAYSEIWNRFDWTETLGICKVASSEQGILNVGESDCYNCRVLQAYNDNPVKDSAERLDLQNYGEKVYVHPVPESLTVWVVYKLKTPLVFPEMRIPDIFMNMLLARTIAHWQQSQGHSEFAAKSMSDYESYFTQAISKQPISETLRNSVNSRLSFEQKAQ